MVSENRKASWRKYNHSHREIVAKKSLENYYKNKDRYIEYQKIHRLENNARTRDKYAIKKAGIFKICVDCGTDKKIHVHHIDFDPLNNNLNNLVYLCTVCHGLKHCN